MGLKDINLKGVHPKRAFSPQPLGRVYSSQFPFEGFCYTCVLPGRNSRLRLIANPSPRTSSHHNEAHSITRCPSLPEWKNTAHRQILRHPAVALDGLASPSPAFWRAASSTRASFAEQRHCAQKPTAPGQFFLGMWSILGPSTCVNTGDGH